MSQHKAKQCMVKGCNLEAEFWIDTTEGFTESLLTDEVPDTFYLCLDHMNELEGNEEHDSSYQYLRIDTGEIHSIIIGKYCCSKDCEECTS